MFLELKKSDALCVGLNESAPLPNRFIELNTASTLVELFGKD